MADDPLAQLVQRTMDDPDFTRRAMADLEGTLAREGYALGPEELAAVREFHAQFAVATPEQVQAGLAQALATATRRQGPGG